MVYWWAVTDVVVGLPQHGQFVGPVESHIECQREGLFVGLVEIHLEPEVAELGRRGGSVRGSG